MKAIIIQFGFSDILFRTNIHALCKTKNWFMILNLWSDILRLSLPQSHHPQYLTQKEQGAEFKLTQDK